MSGGFFKFDAARNKTADENISALSERGQDALSRGNYEKALACYNEILQMDPQNVAAYIGRGIALYGGHDVNGAMADWSKAIQLSPKSPEAFSNRGNAYQRKGDLDNAMIDWSKVRWTPRIGPQVKMDFRWSAGEEKADYESQTQTA